MKSSSLKSEPKVCVSIAPRTLGEASSLLEQADSSRAHYVEVRLDGLRGGLEGLRGVLEKASKPLILTYSTDPALGLGANLTPGEIEPLVGCAEYVDMVYRFPNTKRIGSIHISRSITLDEGLSIAGRVWSEGCDIVKLVFKAEKHSDNVTALKLTSKLDFPNIVFCMGELGTPSRILAPLCGSQWTYASLRSGLETAPGQIDLDTLLELYAIIRGGLR